MGLPLPELLALEELLEACELDELELAVLLEAFVSSPLLPPLPSLSSTPVAHPAATLPAKRVEKRQRKVFWYFILLVPADAPSARWRIMTDDQAFCMLR